MNEQETPSDKVFTVRLWEAFRLPFEMPGGHPFRSLEIACSQVIYADENLKDPSDVKRRAIVLQVIPFAIAPDSSGIPEALKLRNRWLTENPRCLDTVRYPELNHTHDPRLTFTIVETEAMSAIPIMPEGDAWTPIRCDSETACYYDEMPVIGTINRLALIKELIPAESSISGDVTTLLGHLQNLEYERVSLGEISQLERDLLFSSDHIQASDVERVKGYFSELRQWALSLNPPDAVLTDEIITAG